LKNYLFLKGEKVDFSKEKKLYVEFYGKMIIK